MAIQRLNQGTPSLGSQIPIWDATNCQDRRVSLNEIVELIQESLTIQGVFATTYLAPSANAWVLTIAPAEPGQNVWALITPTGPFATGTINFPSAAVCVDGQEILVSCTQSMAALIVTGPVVGAPTAISAVTPFRMRFDGVFKNWYRVG
jgi:hypothetical protein